MSIAEDYRADRKARLIRLGALQPYQAPAFVAPKPSIPPQAFDAGWQGMWFFDLVTNYSSLEQRHIRIRDVQYAVADYFEIEPVDLLSSRRTKDIVRPRQIGYYLCKKLTLRSLPEIGRRFGRDHTSILAGIRKIEQLRLTDAKIAADVRAIASRLGGRT